MLTIKKSKLHGTGAFASRKISKNTKIIQYRGEKIRRSEGNKRSEQRIKKYLNSKDKGSVYIFELNSKYDIDGTPSYNKAKFINHSCEPNCEVEIINDEIWITSIKTIMKNEELTYDYGYSFDKEDYKDHICNCDAKNCIGYIISSDEWNKFLNHIKKIVTKRNKS